tara:strand:- start:4800 stop:5066 length:267 start_codon:yes stop_codon:yes gene_type:complete
MKLAFISCQQCNNTKGFVRNSTLAECTSCNSAVTISEDTVVVHPYEMTELDEVLEQELEYQEQFEEEVVNDFAYWFDTDNPQFGASTY